MAPRVPAAAALLVVGAFWRQVSGEARSLSEGASKVISSGSSAALSEEGYHQVANLKSDEQMHKFVSRLLNTEGLEASTADLSGFVPWYSGTRAIQSLQKLREELFTKPWVRRVFSADPAPVAAKSEAAPLDSKAKPKAKPGKAAHPHSAHLTDKKAKLRAKSSVGAVALKNLPRPWELKSRRAADLPDWVVTEAKQQAKPKAKPGNAVQRAHSKRAAAIDLKAKPKAKPGKASHPHPAHLTAKKAAAKAVAPDKKAKRRAKSGALKSLPRPWELKSRRAADLPNWVVTEAKHEAKSGVAAPSAAQPAAAVPAAVAVEKPTHVPSVEDTEAGTGATLAGWVVTEVKKEAKPGVAAPSAAQPAAAVPAAVAVEKPTHVPSVEDTEAGTGATLAGWVMVNAHQKSNVKHDVTSPAAHVLPKAKHQSQLVSAKPRGRALSWIAQESQLSASKITRSMGNKLGKPILVMKDLSKLHAEDRDRLFESIENTSVLLEAVDGKIKVLRGSDVSKLVNLTKELEHKQPQELVSIMESKGVKCKGCTPQEQLDRVIATWAWPAVHKHEARSQADISKDTVQEKTTFTSKACKSKCYAEQHAEASWTGQKCKWKNCGGCPECENKGDSGVAAANTIKDSSVRLCNAKCYTGKHADMPWGNHKCKFRNCKGCPECDDKLVAKRPAKSAEKPAKSAEKAAARTVTCASHCFMGSQSWKDKKCKWKNCDGCPKCADEPQGVSNDRPHDHEGSGKSSDAKTTLRLADARERFLMTDPHDPKTTLRLADARERFLMTDPHDHGRSGKSHLSELAVDTAAENDGTVVDDAAKSTAKSDTVVENAGAVVSDVVEEAVQGASKVASSIFSTFLGFFGHADKTESQDEHELKKAAPHTNAKEDEEKKAQEVQKATEKAKAAQSSHDKPMEPENHVTSNLDKKAVSVKPLDAADPEDPHASKVNKVTIPTEDKMTNFLAKPAHTHKASKAMPSGEADVKAPEETEAAKPQKSSEFAQASEIQWIRPEDSETKQTSNLKARPSRVAKATVTSEVDKAPKAKKTDKTLQTPEVATVSDTANGITSLETAVSSQKSTSPISRERLPGVPKLTENSTKIMEDLNTQISTLKEQLAEAESESERAVASKKAEYEGKLQQQHENTTAMKKMNKELRQSVHTLFKENSQLRITAKEIKDEANQLREKIVDLQANLNLAGEYLDGTLENTSTSKDDEKVHVLRELDEQDALHAKSEEHASALKQVGSIALLQISSKSESSDPLEVVRMLAGRFDDLDREEAASLDALQTHFEEQLNQETQNQDALMKENDELKISEDGQLALREKLQAAVNHLRDTRSFLQDQIKGLQAYALKLAA